jgi:uncharacterized protein (TIGR02001 family)
MKRIVILAAMAAVLASGSAWGADVTTALEINSAYVWRGITFNDGIVAQPSLDVSHKGFGINVWGNYDFDDYEDTLDEQSFSEVDLTASYSFKIKEADVSVGLVDYLFPSSGAEDTLELFLGFGMEIVDGLSAGLNFYYDVDEVDSFYADLNLAWSMALNDALTLELGGKVGFAGDDFAEYYSSEATDGGFYDVGLSAGLTYALSDALSLGAKINYTESLDDDVLPDASVEDGVYGHDTEFYGGVGISYAF